MEMLPEDRRVFLKKAGATLSATGAAAFLQQKAGANSSQALRVGVIGVGSQGKGHVSRFNGMDDVELVYICDPDMKRAGEVARDVDGVKVVSDLRRVLDDKTIDAVSIATPDHWHAPAAIMACDAGKHVYVEKPCAHSFREAQLLLSAARRNNRVVQHGTQQRSKRTTADAMQMLREGIIGDVLVAKAWNVQRRGTIGREQPSDPPSDFDYDMWVGPAEFVPFQKNCHHYHWRWWHNFGSGDMGNDGVHELDYARWGLGADGIPSKVSAIGGKYFFDDDQQFPDTQTVVFEYAGTDEQPMSKQLIFEMRLWSTNYPFNCDSGVEYYGTKGKMFISKRGKFEVYADRNQRMKDPKPQEPAPLLAENHYRDFVDAIKNDRKPQADIQIGFESTALSTLGNLATRLGRTITLDPNQQIVLGDEEANSMLTRTYRNGGHWAIPQGA
ncbi:MAG: dehydrogenase [Planctomycetaceae bacterium]|nr:dehydrogenase [Planctomycetaceae bacterium]